MLEVDSPYAEVPHADKAYLGIRGYWFVVHITKNVSIGDFALCDGERSYGGQNLVVLPSDALKANSLPPICPAGPNI